MGNPYYRNFGLLDAKALKATGSTACTLTDSGDLVTSAAHGLSNGYMLSFLTIVTTTGISVSTRYYVISATTNTFQVATTVGGSAVALTTDGSGTFNAIKEYDIYLANEAQIDPKTKTLTWAGDDTEYETDQVLGYSVTLNADALQEATKAALFSLTAITTALPTTSPAATANTSMLYGGTVTERSGAVCGLYFTGTATRVDASTGIETNVYVTRYFWVGRISGVKPAGNKTGDKSDVEGYKFTASKTTVDLVGTALPATVPTGGVFYSTMEVAVP
jgi:hypothetical protein